MASKLIATQQKQSWGSSRPQVARNAIIGGKKGAATPNDTSAKKKPASSGKGKDSKSTSSEAKTSATGTASNGKLPSMREVQEQKRQERQEKLKAAKEKVLEQRRLKRQHQLERQEELRKRQRWSLITFVLGLFVMLTALIALFPSTPMIIFSTLLMFSFFFLGIAYQRMVMQLLVIALACVFITGAFYAIVSSI